MTMIRTHRNRYSTTLLHFQQVLNYMIHVHITLQMIRLIKVPFSITLGTAQMNKIDTVSPTFHDTRQIILCRYAK